MAEILRSHDESLMPMRMGSPYRVPDYAYPLYGLKYQNETLANQAYMAEWAAGSKDQIALVSRATKAAGFTDFNDLLRQVTAKIIAGTVKSNYFLKSPTILEIGAGAGASGLTIVKALPPDIGQKTTMILVDPSKESLQTAEQLILDQEVNCKILVGTDTEVLRTFRSQSVDILTGVASVHHHAGIPFDEYARVLKPGGFAIFADWHHDIWEHPARVFEFLQRFTWPTKQTGLVNWFETYRRALNRPDWNVDIAPEDIMAREQITRFWLAYKRIANKANLGPNAIWPLEGHRPVYRYIENMQQAGLPTQTPGIRHLINAHILPDNPYQILPNSSLLQVTIGQRYQLS